MSNINAKCNPCRTCRYENDPQKLGHCYMFMEEPISCGSYNAVNVGTIGHIDHGKTSLVAAMMRIVSKDKP